MAKRALNNLSTNLQQLGLNVSLKRSSDSENPSFHTTNSKRHKVNSMSSDSQENCQQSLGTIKNKIKLGLENLTNHRLTATNPAQSVTSNDKLKLKLTDENKLQLIDSQSDLPLFKQPASLSKSQSLKSKSSLKNDKSIDQTPSSASQQSSDLIEVAAEVEIENDFKKSHFNFFTSSDLKDFRSLYDAPSGLPADVEDYDRRQLNEIDSEPNYAYAAFEYYFQREKQFVVPKYLQNQPEISRTHRAILVDWIVEVQEVFQLNHETMYQAIKIIDIYMSRHEISRRKLQLLGCTALFISSKYDERVSHNLESYIIASDNVCSRSDIIQMEREILKELQFDIGMPLSYRFLRRFARCAKITMELLTFARYILEMSLMEYDFVSELDSKMAAASLLLAIKSKADLNLSWNSTLEFYSTYNEKELIPLMDRINRYLQTPMKSYLKNIKAKYSSPIFFSVAKFNLYPIPK